MRVWYELLLGQLKRIPLCMGHAANMSLYALRRHATYDGLIPRDILSLCLVNRRYEKYEVLIF